MKRDNDFIRELLIEVEDTDDIYIMANLHLSSSHDDLKRHHHCELLCDAGLLMSINKGTYRMTNQGHDYLSSIRNDTVWQDTKEGAAKLSGVTLDMMKDIAIAYIKREATDKLGIQL